MKSACIAVAIWASLLGTTASAQIQPGRSQTLDAYTYEKTSNGHLYGCEIVFQHALENYAYHQGNLDYLSGSVALTMRDGPPSITYKLVVERVDKDADGKTSFVPETPAHIMLIGNSGRTYLPAKPIASETAGGMLAAYPFEEVGGDVLNRVLQQHEIGVAYNYGASGTDVKATINLDRGSDDHPGANVVADFAACADRMYQELKKAED